MKSRILCLGSLMYPSGIEFLRHILHVITQKSQVRFISQPPLLATVSFPIMGQGATRDMSKAGRSVCTKQRWVTDPGTQLVRFWQLCPFSFEGTLGPVSSGRCQRYYIAV